MRAGRSKFRMFCGLGTLLIGVPAILLVRHFAADPAGEPHGAVPMASSSATQALPPTARQQASAEPTERQVRDVTPPGVARVYMPPQAPKPRQPENRSIYIAAPAVTPNGMIAGDGGTVRLYGIAFPDAKKICTTASGERWPCGRRAYIALHNKVATQVISCEPRASDSQASDCFLGDVNLAAWLLAQGLVRLLPEVGDGALLAAEAGAKKARLGLWSDPQEAGTPQQSAQGP